MEILYLYFYLCLVSLCLVASIAQYTVLGTPYELSAPGQNLNEQTIYGAGGDINRSPLQADVCELIPRSPTITYTLRGEGGELSPIYMRLDRIELSLLAPEASALSVGLQARRSL